MTTSASPRRIATASSKLGRDKRSNPRIWLEGRKLEKAGFNPQVRYTMTIDEASRQIVLELDPAGDRIVSRRARRGNDIPIIDIANAKALSGLAAIETLRVDFVTGRIIISPSAVELRRAERNIRTKQRLENGEPLRTGSVSTGLGVLSLAIHEGLAKAGIASEMAFSVEIDPEYQDLSAERNPVWDERTVAINMPLQEFAFDREAADAIEQVDILEAGIPCTAHSLAGRAKKHLAKPEDDPVAGHLVVGFLAIVAACNPTAIIVENVPQYAQSASFAILANQLTEWGYQVSYDILRGKDHGCLEHRDRMALVALTPGMEFDFTAIRPAEPPVRRLGDVLDTIPEDSSLWSEMTYLREKEKRDIEAGKGFRMQILGEEATHVGTIGRGYAKCRSTEIKVKHPANDRLLRQLTPAEHARVKGVPPEFVDGLSITTAHEMLGQSILMAPFRALGDGLGQTLTRWHGTPAADPIAPRAPIAPPANNNEPARSDDQLQLFG
ncbi:DNA cytosine methyltransferase [Croceicoccus gelatinilyticus]|uniref:DNA cytosine methyltransferase n=1 Tax=Croceicoccus gelatinilyticus TaxID=2835536 RepID=UPI001BD07B7F|nr:DNA cytosine methyltransferase [Croceicoccus gelatinilyticus]MBS7671421.1 DNA cytosine methyltransferase [Croceicoccus gelatinilyticus]